MHTVYSDGTGKHSDIGKAALKAGIDVAIITDHNVLVRQEEVYQQNDDHQVLIMVGEEVHDQARQPQKNHLLVIGGDRELATFAPKLQQLILQAQRSGALTFIAHPFEDSMPAFGEDEIGWVDWDVRDFTGIELWNGLSEIKTVSHNTFQAVFYAFFPQFIAHGPKPETVRKWNELLEQGKRVVAICGSDAHQLKLVKGILKRTLFPYEFHFRSINNHLLVPNDLTGNLASDRHMILEALRLGHCFIGYDYPAPTRGFRFTAQGKDKIAQIGDDINLENGVTLQIKLPLKVECQLLRNGSTIKTWKNREICAMNIDQGGVYRVECFINYLGERRSWIISNPIFVNKLKSRNQ